MQHAANAAVRRGPNRGRGIRLRVACVHHERTAHVLRQVDLVVECRTLSVAGGVVVVVVEPAFADRHRPRGDRVANPHRVACRVVARGVVGVHTRRRKYLLRISLGERPRIGGRHL